MTVSVIVPCLRKDALFKRCLASIQGQNPVDGMGIEIVIVEGVAPAGRARNEGLRRATGDWIAWVDSDDEIEPGWFEGVCGAIRLADAEKADIVVVGLAVVRDGRSRPLHYGRQSVVPAEILVDDLLRDMRIGGHICRYVTRRRLWNDAEFDERLPALEDYEALPRVLRRGRRAVCLDEVLYRYIVREGSLSTGADARLRMTVAAGRAETWGRCAAVGACVMAYNCLYDRVDAGGEARRWIRRHLRAALTDGEVPVKWKLKFVLASLGIMIRRPK